MQGGCLNGKVNDWFAFLIFISRLLLVKWGMALYSCFLGIAEGKILGLAVLLTNLYEMHSVAIPLCGARVSLAMLFITIVQHNDLYRGSLCCDSFVAA